jgi:hypothetical protein
MQFKRLYGVEPPRNYFKMLDALYLSGFCFDKCEEVVYCVVTFLYSLSAYLNSNLGHL